MQVFLERFARTLAADEHAVMVVDQAGWHVADILVVPSNVSLIFQPAYSPELNPVERVWLFLRERHLSHRLLDSYDAIVEALCKAWNALDAERLVSLANLPLPPGSQDLSGPVLDLTHVLKEDATEFESLDMAIHMLFLARSHSYEVSRAISWAVKDADFDGLIYPSFFSLVRTGGLPFETAYGLSLRRFHPQAEQYAKAFTIPNFALFGRPLESSLVRVECINRLILTQIGYRGHFGPVSY